MEKEESFMAKFIVVLLWIVRIWSLLIVVVVLIFFLGEEVFGNESPDIFNVPIIPLIAGIFMSSDCLEMGNNRRHYLSHWIHRDSNY
jgi:hypothetical protein